MLALTPPDASLIDKPRPSARLSGVQALRGVAASAVVLSHAARHVDKAFGAPWLITIFQAGHAGVDLFFAISGFIILFVHHQDIGRPDRLMHYWERRFTRVLPLYWVALALTIGMSAAGGGGLPPPATALWAASLLPSVHEPLLGIAWTLQFEAVFYTVFAVLIVSRVTGVAVFALWLAWIAVTAAGFGAAAIPPSLCGIYGVEFFIGMGVSWLMTHGRVPAPVWLAIVGAALFVTAMVLESIGMLNGFGVTARFAYSLPAALLVLGVAAAERGGQLSLPAWMQKIGEASYSTYLFQFVFIGIVWQMWLRGGLAHRGSDLVCFATLACAALAGGFFTSRFVEHPMLRALRRKGGSASARKGLLF